MKARRIVQGQIDAARGALRRGSLRRRVAVGGGRPSSITDEASYLDFCALAAADPSAFGTFRREPIYVQTLEHVTEEQGAQYLSIIRRDSPDLLGEFLPVLHANDRLGSPVLYEFPGIGRMSPVTLRYGKVLSDLERLFGDLTGKRVIEIGVGYGGQCRLIVERWAVETYTLVDLQPALHLAERYLAESGSYPVVFQSPEQVASAGYDLCISNYAFSELSRDVQAVYAESVVGSASRGYLTCNFISDLFGIRSWSREELGLLHAGTHWLPEEPLTFEGNAILVWGDKGGLPGGSRGNPPGVV